MSWHSYHLTLIHIIFPPFLSLHLIHWAVILLGWSHSSLIPIIHHSKSVLLLPKKGIFVPLLGVATLECVRHVARYLILTVRINHRARWLSHPRPGAPNRRRKYEIVVYTNTNWKCLVKYPTNSPIRCPTPGVWQSPGTVVYFDSQNKSPRQLPGTLDTCHT